MYGILSNIKAKSPHIYSAINNTGCEWGCFWSLCWERERERESKLFHGTIKLKALIEFVFQITTFFTLLFSFQFVTSDLLTFSLILVHFVYWFSQSCSLLLTIVYKMCMDGIDFSIFNNKRLSFCAYENI